MKSHELAKKLLELPDLEIDIRGIQYDDDVQIVRVSGDGPVVVIEIELIDKHYAVADTHYQCTGCNTTPCDCHETDRSRKPDTMRLFAHC